MGRKEKLIERFKKKPKDFTWNELTNMMKSFGYDLLKKSSGSRRKFYNPETGDKVFIHEPHPENTLKTYQVDNIYNHLLERGLIKK